MAQIGIVPGEELDRSKLPKAGEKLDPTFSLLKIVEDMKEKKPVNGWLYWISNAGAYGTDYVQSDDRIEPDDLGVSDRCRQGPRRRQSDRA
jgi:hypothetical protein